MGGGSHPRGPATPEEMAAARLPIASRDACAHLLIPLNKCRVKTYYMPWECTHERHAYEKCEYIEWLKRSKDPKKAAAAKLEHQ
mmetsp:Transcript_1984/g.5034  ORF Transcript_1984/g.5034 Transcript_1984/m.5034 type:complete len:84 (+) Transcript_1984:80-331(+)|eukprot:CAMPEP_0197423356 /NCGR_PEP_ID=MMETSP1170-20131217/21078_1 /TAXON_ID=54406 /ORGANISM="Sarcinochrysis sp, Strain CCMP770" /LENGTH=83 /DNA_ID=CAMNT_0042950769 /DNA_START=79 /DNA_END=330 /DNA_ORIENTATION=+